MQVYVKMVRSIFASEHPPNKNPQHWNNYIIASIFYLNGCKMQDVILHALATGQ